MKQYSQADIRELADAVAQYAATVAKNDPEAFAYCDGLEDGLRLLAGDISIAGGNARLAAIAGLAAEMSEQEEKRRRQDGDGMPQGWLPTLASHESVARNEPMVLVTGTPTEGLKFIGPVTPNDPDLEYYTDVDPKPEYWWYAALAPLPRRRR